MVQVVEMADLPEGSPVDVQSLISLADVPLGKVSLFDLNLSLIEKKLLSHPWVKEVQLQKRFPQTVSVSVVLRQPRAILQGDQGDLSYVDPDGHAFGKVTSAFHGDLPIVSGIEATRQDRLQEALQLLATWERSALASQVLLSGIKFDPERGFRATVSYALLGGARSRAMVDLGSGAGPELESSLGRLTQVFHHLGERRISARQIWAENPKKIIVRTGHES